MLILCRQLNCWSQRGPRGSDQFLDNADRSMSGLNQWTVIQTAQSCGCRVLLVEKEEGGALSLCSTRLISEALFLAPIRAEEVWSLCGMRTEKKTASSAFGENLSQGSTTYSHNINFDSQTRLTHKIPYLLVHLLPMLLLAPVIHRHSCICIHL